MYEQAWAFIEERGRVIHEVGFTLRRVICSALQIRGEEQGIYCYNIYVDDIILAALLLNFVKYAMNLETPVVLQWWRSPNWRDKGREKHLQMRINAGCQDTRVAHLAVFTTLGARPWTGRIFNTDGLKWVPTGKTFTSSTTKVDCELPKGSNNYITNPYKCDQTLDVSVGSYAQFTLLSAAYSMVRKEFVSKSHGDTLISIDFLTSRHLSNFAANVTQCELKIINIRVLRIILVILPEHQSDTQVITVKIEILLEPTSNKLMVGNGSRLFKDGGGVKEFQRSLRHSDTERLSRSDEVLKLKNFKKDATLKFSKSTNQERYEHDWSRSRKFTRWQSFKMAKRLCLVDDLKMLKITMSNTSSRNKLYPEINDHYNIFTRESQEYELKTKDKA
ncbi:hypothetical protein Tco_0720623 [Tanacetum coccineum]